MLELRSSLFKVLPQSLELEVQAFFPLEVEEVVLDFCFLHSTSLKLPK